MKTAISAIAATFCLIVMSSASEARGPLGSINVGNWHGGAYTDDKSGAFSHCAAGASYQSGIYFVVSVGENFSWRLGFAHDNWQLTPGQAFALALTFDGQQAINVQGLPIGSHLVNVEMPANSSLISQFRKAKVMTAFAQGQLFQFTLTQTAQPLPSLVNCVVSVKKNGIASATEFAVTLPKPAAAAVPAQAGPNPLRSTKTVNKIGTGFVISSSGHVVTNQHVVDGCVGVIQGNLSGEAPIKLRLTSDFTVTTGVVNSLSGVLSDTRYLQISAAVQPGNSGGPLLDAGGELVGIVAAKLNALKFAKETGDIPENINFAIKNGSVEGFSGQQRRGVSDG
jgi:S1-C subfamily serine protease